MIEQSGPENIGIPVENADFNYKLKPLIDGWQNRDISSQFFTSSCLSYIIQFLFNCLMPVQYIIHWTILRRSNSIKIRQKIFFCLLRRFTRAASIWSWTSGAAGKSRIIIIMFTFVACLQAIHPGKYNLFHEKEDKLEDKDKCVLPVKASNLLKQLFIRDYSVQAFTHIVPLIWWNWWWEPRQEFCHHIHGNAAQKFPHQCCLLLKWELIIKQGEDLPIKSNRLSKSHKCLPYGMKVKTKAP